MNLARFPEYKASLQEKELQSLAASKITNGVFNDPKKQKGYYRLINVLDMFRGDSIDVTLLSSLDLDLTEFEKNQVKYGDIFFTRSSLVASGIAWSNVNLSDADNLTFDGHLMKLSINLEQYDPRYIAQYCRAFPIRKQLMRRGKTGTMTTIGQSDIADVKFHIPCLLEQQKIADFLTSVDTRIQQLKQKQSLLQQYKKGLMQQLFSQTLRFKDDNGNSFPGWDEAEFHVLAERSSLKLNPAKQTTKLPCVELESLSQDTGKLLETFPANDQKSIKNAFVKGEVLFGKLRPYLRKFLMPDFDGVCSSEIWVLKGKAVSNSYLYQLIQSHRFTQAANVSSGSKMPRSDWEFLSSTPFFYPRDEGEQTKIANALTAMDKKIDLVAQQIEHTQTFKKGLLQQMFV
jgi:type I restriction enzyme S subunit